MTDINYLKLREEIIATCLRMNALGINQGTSGNVSVRIENGLLITPSGIPYDAMQPEQIVEMDDDGGYVGDYLPSSEWRMHYDILRHRPEAGAVVHTHAAHCTALSCLRMKIPAFHYLIAVAGGTDIRCSDYATYGTQALSDAMLTALKDRRACLLGNHGMICFGPNLEKALSLAVEVENLARQYWLARQINPPAILPEEEMRIVLDRIKSYGKQTHELDPDAPPAFIPPPRRDAPQQASSEPS
ncbi:MAG: class II aldolase/adducin family protein [Planctomycetes bacterium]|nr:class II aldolase/adducin family protein [Planctomycetota bacterium]